MKQLFLRTIVLLTGILALTSCTNDDTDKIKETNKKKYAMFIKTGKTDGILASFEKIPSGNIKVADILKEKTSYLQMKNVGNPGFVFNGVIYNTYNLEGQSGIQKIKINEDNTFNVGGFIPTQTDSRGAGSDIFAIGSNTKGYYSNIKLSKTALQMFNPTTMERTGEIDFSEKINAIKKSLKVVKSTAIGKFMVVRDGKLFTEIFFYDDKNNQVIDKSYIAVVDTESNTLEKILIHNDFVNFGIYKNSNYVKVDKKNNLYISGFSGNRTDKEGFNYRVIRIKSGETEIDKTWSINANKDFDGIDFALGGGAVKDGKVYLKAFSNAIDSDPSRLWGKTYGAYIVDLESKKITLINDIPVGYWGRSSNHGPTFYEGKPFFSVLEQSPEKEKADGHIESFYSYDNFTGKSTKEFTIVGGTPEHFIKL